MADMTAALQQTKLPRTKHHYTAGTIVWTIIKYFSLIFFSAQAVIPIVSCVITASSRRRSTSRRM